MSLVSYDDRPSVGTTLKGILERTRDAVIEVVRQANEVTESETLAAGAAMSRIVKTARGTIQGMKETLELVLGGDDAGNISETMMQQTADTQSYLTRLENSVQAQVTITTQAAAQTAEIREAGARISSLSSASRILAFNAMIEASRYGEQGAAFRVIAEEMQSLAQDIEAANQRIGGLAHTLGEVIPRIQDAADDILVRAQAFRADNDKGVEKLAIQTSMLASSVEEMVTEADGKVAEIINDSHDALSHLQFQDPTAQRLLRIDSFMADAEREVASHFGLDGDEASVDDIVHTEIGQYREKDVDLDEGEVLLF